MHLLIPLAPSSRQAEADAFASALKSSETTFGDPLQAASFKQTQQAAGDSSATMDPLAAAATAQQLADSAAAPAEAAVDGVNDVVNEDKEETPILDIAESAADLIPDDGANTDTPDLDAAEGTFSTVRA